MRKLFTSNVSEYMYMYMARIWYEWKYCYEYVYVDLQQLLLLWCYVPLVLSGVLPGTQTHRPNTCTCTYTLGFMSYHFFIILLIARIRWWIRGTASRWAITVRPRAAPTAQSLVGRRGQLRQLTRVRFLSDVTLLSDRLTLREDGHVVITAADLRLGTSDSCNWNGTELSWRLLSGWSLRYRLLPLAVTVRTIRWWRRATFCQRWSFLFLSTWGSHWFRSRIIGMDRADISCQVHSHSKHRHWYNGSSRYLRCYYCSRLCLNLWSCGNGCLFGRTFTLLLCLWFASISPLALLLSSWCRYDCWCLWCLWFRLSLLTLFTTIPRSNSSTTTTGSSTSLCCRRGGVIACSRRGWGDGGGCEVTVSAATSGQLGFGRCVTFGLHHQGRGRDGTITINSSWLTTISVGEMQTWSW